MNTLTDPAGCDLTTMKVWCLGCGKFRCENQHDFCLEDVRYNGLALWTTEDVFRGIEMLFDIVMRSVNTCEPTPFDKENYLTMKDIEWKK